MHHNNIEKLNGITEHTEFMSKGVQELRSLKSFGTKNSLALKARVLSALFNLIWNSRNQDHLFSIPMSP